MRVCISIVLKLAALNSSSCLHISFFCWAMLVGDSAYVSGQSRLPKTVIHTARVSYLGCWNALDREKETGSCA